MPICIQKTTKRKLPYDENTIIFWTFAVIRQISKRNHRHTYTKRITEVYSVNSGRQPVRDDTTCALRGTMTNRDRPVIAKAKGTAPAKSSGKLVTASGGSKTSVNRTNFGVYDFCIFFFFFNRT